MRIFRAVALGVVSALALSGCSAFAGHARDQDGAEDDLLVGKSPTGIIHELSRLPIGDRPADLTAVVHPHHLVLTQGEFDVRMTLPEGQFYLAVAPYIGRAPECHHHDLTSDLGPLPGARLEVRVVEAGSGEVLVERSGVIADNGFIGFWLPRDTAGTVEVSTSAFVGSVEFATNDDDPTCLAGPRLIPADVSRG